MEQESKFSIPQGIMNISDVYLPLEIIINLFLAFFLGLAISLVYKKTHKGLSYSQSFMLTNIFVCLIVCMVIMIIGNSLARAFALVGALSIIRFRTVVKDTKDTAYIFWSLAAGMAAGTGSYFLAIVGTIIISSVAFILYFSNYGSFVKSEFILQFRLDTKIKDHQDFIKVIKSFTSVHTLLSSESSDDGKSLKNSYDIIMKEKYESKDLIQELSKLKNITELVVVAGKSDIDY
jgi:uncharacterized membrane protein YhiD involved in acid resistance